MRDFWAATWLIYVDFLGSIIGIQFDFSDEEKRNSFNVSPELYFMLELNKAWRHFSNFVIQCPVSEVFEKYYASWYFVVP